MWPSAEGASRTAYRCIVDHLQECHITSGQAHLKGPSGICSGTSAAVHRLRMAKNAAMSRAASSGSSAGHHGPAADVVQAFGPLPRRLALGDEHVREHRHRGRHMDHIAGAEARLTLPAAVVVVVTYR